MQAKLGTGPCAALRAAAVVSLLLLAGSVYLTEVGLPQDEPPGWANYRVSAAGLVSRGRQLEEGARIDCQLAAQTSSCYAEEDRLHGGADKLPSRKVAVVRKRRAAVRDEDRQAKEGGEADRLDDFRIKLPSLHRGPHLGRANSVGPPRTDPPDSEASEGGSRQTKGLLAQETMVGARADGRLRKGLKEASLGFEGREASETRAEVASAAGSKEEGNFRTVRSLQEHVQQCIVRQGRGLRAAAVPGDACRIRVMHPPHVEVTWKDSTAQHNDTREFEFDLCELAVYWSTVKNSSLILTKEYLDSHDASAAVLHRMRFRKSSSDLWCPPRKCVRILRGHIPERPPFSPGHFQTCALIGNSADLLKAEAGAEIDGHDAVFRMNGAPTGNYSKHVGSKTTFRVVNNRAWTDGLGALSESDDEVFILHGLFSREIFKEMRFGLPRALKRNGTNPIFPFRSVRFSTNGMSARAGAGKADGKGDGGTSGRKREESEGDTQSRGGPINRTGALNESHGWGDEDRGDDETGNQRGVAIGAEDEVEWTPPLPNPVLFMDVPSATVGNAEGTGFRALQLAQSVCQEVHLYGYSVDVGYKTWGKYFTQDGPGHLPLLGIMYYQVLECLGGVSLHSSARSARSPGAPPPTLLSDVLPLMSARFHPECSRWAGAFTPHSPGRNSCNSLTALPLRESPMRGARFGSPAALNLEVAAEKMQRSFEKRPRGGFEVMEKDGGMLPGVTSPSEDPVLAVARKEAGDLIGGAWGKREGGARQDRQEKQQGLGQYALTRYLDNFDWQKHVCVIKAETRIAAGGGADVPGAEVIEGTSGFYESNQLNASSWDDMVHRNFAKSRKEDEKRKPSWFSKYRTDMC